MYIFDVSDPKKPPKSPEIKKESTLKVCHLSFYFGTNMRQKYIKEAQAAELESTTKFDTFLASYTSNGSYTSSNTNGKGEREEAEEDCESDSGNEENLRLSVSSLGRGKQDEYHYSLLPSQHT